MTYDPDIHHRRSIRLPGYDYSRVGVYYVTVCTHRRECLFGEVMDGEMHLSEAGEAVADEWVKSAQIRREIELDTWVVMPNHFHGIVVISEPVGDQSEGDRPVAPTDDMPAETRDRKPGPRPKSLSALMAGFKAAVTIRVNALRATPGVPVWQRNYYERIIRNERELDAVRRYIANNPARWFEDDNHPGKMNR